jgi:PAS domain S-box-containing protein
MNDCSYNHISIFPHVHIPTNILYLSILGKTILSRYLKRDHKTNATHWELIPLQDVKDDKSIGDDDYLNILEMANDGVVVIQEDKIVMCNPAFAEMLQYERTNLLGKHFEDFLDPVAAHLYFENQEKFEWGQQNRPSFRIRLLKARKETVTVEITTADFIYDGKPAIGVIARNITEKIALESAIEESEAKYRNLFDSSPIAYFTLSPRGTIQQVNSAACDLLGYEEVSLMKRNISSFITNGDSDTDIAAQILMEINQGKSIHDFEMKMVRRNSESIWVSLTASPIPTSSRIPAVGFMVVDINRRKMAEIREQQERNRANLYLEVMTHDLNNVNQSLMFSLELLREKIDLPTVVQEMLRDTQWSVRRSSRMIASMRSIINLKESPPEREKIDITVPIGKGITRACEDFHWKNLEVENNIPQGEFYVAGHSYLDDVFFHLIHNVLTYDESKDVKVIIDGEPMPSTNTIRITVTDFGPGVPDRIKNRIFRRTGAPDQQMVGRGLGLTLVDQIIRDLEGEIYVIDRVEGDYTQGAQFIVEIPVWVEIEELACGRSTCITFYKSNHCLFCEPTYEVLLGVIEEMGLPSYLVEVINIDDPNVDIDENELPMLPFIKICDDELTGFVGAEVVRSALLKLLGQPCYPDPLE